MTTEISNIRSSINLKTFSIEELKSLALAALQEVEEREEVEREKEWCIVVKAINNYLTLGYNIIMETSLGAWEVCDTDGLTFPATGVLTID